MSASVRKCSLAELKGNAGFPALFKEYAEECALRDLPAPDEKLAAYDAIERSGVFQIYGAFCGEKLVGVVAVLTPVIPHYGVAIAVAESLFVAKRHRKSGAGIRLLIAAERHAKDIGSPALMVSAPVGGVLAEVLPRLGYRETNRVFLRGLAP
jgi:GNAT superfamily N-acetyltransferase